MADQPRAAKRGLKPALRFVFAIVLCRFWHDGQSAMAKRTLYDLSREAPSVEEVKELIAEITKGQSDRLAVILATIFLQDALCKLIIVQLENVEPAAIDRLYGRGGPLSTFYSQIQLGYVMGRYNDAIRQDLDVIRRIRNAFAHTIKPINFRTPEVAKECAKIKSPVATRIISECRVPPDEHRARFVMAVTTLAAHFLKKLEADLGKLEADAEKEKRALIRRIKRAEGWEQKLERPRKSSRKKSD